MGDNFESGAREEGARSVELRLVARIRTDDREGLRPTLDDVVRRHAGTCEVGPDGFGVRLTWEAPSARDANRALLNELRRVVRRTRLRAEWTHGSTVERFFDYVPKGVREASTPPSSPGR